jgi:hypothetical protein
MEWADASFLRLKKYRDERPTCVRVSRKEANPSSKLLGFAGNLTLSLAQFSRRTSRASAANTSGLLQTPS